MNIVHPRQIIFLGHVVRIVKIVSHRFSSNIALFYCQSLARPPPISMMA